MANWDDIADKPTKAETVSWDSVGESKKTESWSDVHDTNAKESGMSWTDAFKAALDDFVGVTEATGSVLSGAPGYAIGGLGAIGDIIRGKGTDSAVKTMERASKAVDDKIRYTPKTDVGNELLNSFGQGVENLRGFGGDVGVNMSNLIPSISGTPPSDKEQDIARSLGEFGTDMLLNFAPLPAFAGKPKAGPKTPRDIFIEQNKASGLHPEKLGQIFDQMEAKKAQPNVGMQEQRAPIDSEFAQPELPGMEPDYRGGAMGGILRDDIRARLEQELNPPVEQRAAGQGELFTGERAYTPDELMMQQGGISAKNRPETLPRDNVGTRVSEQDITANRAWLPPEVGAPESRPYERTGEQLGMKFDEPKPDTIPYTIEEKPRFDPNKPYPYIPEPGINPDKQLPLGQRMKKQGGVIDPDLLTLGTAKVWEKVGKDWQKLMDKFKGTFAKNAIDDLIMESRNPRSRETVVLMSPEDFHKLAENRPAGYFLSDIPKEKQRNVKEGLKTTSGLRDIPYLSIEKMDNGDWKVVGHEGRHRMDVFKEQGMDLIPVRVKARESVNGTIRWGESNERPKTIHPQWENKITGPRLPMEWKWDSLAFPRDKAPQTQIPKLDFGDSPGMTKIGESQRGGITFRKKENASDVAARTSNFKEWSSEMEKIQPNIKLLHEAVREAMYEEAAKAPKIESSKNPGIEPAKDIPGLKQVLKDFMNDTRPYNEISTEFYDYGKDIKQDPNTIYSRANYYSGQIMKLVSQHPYVGWVVDTVKSAMRNAEIATDRDLNGQGTMRGMRKERTPDGALSVWRDKLKPEQRKQIVDTGFEFNFDRYLSPDELSSRGFTPEMVDAYTAMTTKLSEKFDQVNRVRVKNGLEAIEKRPGYWPSRRVGDFSVTVKDLDGKVIWVQDLPSKYHAKQFIKQAQRKLGEGITANVTKRKYNTSIESDMAAFDVLFNTLSRNDPRTKALSSVFKEYVATEKRGFPKHFIDAYNIKGRLGDELTATPKVSAERFERSYEAYIASLNKYLSLEAARPDLAASFADTKLMDTMPNAVEYGRQYYNHARGDTSSMNRFKVIDSAVEKAVEVATFNQIGGATGRDFLVRNAKKVTYNLALALFNLKYLAQGVIQPHQFTPTILDSIGTRIGANVGDAHGSWAKALAEMSTTLSPEMKEARQFAVDRNVFNPKIISDIEYKPTAESAKHAAKETLLGVRLNEGVEQVSRYQAYMGAARFMLDNLDRLGVSKKEAFQMAENVTNLAMTDYSRYERPMLYAKLGNTLGEFGSTFMTFQHNYYGQLNYLVNQVQSGKSAASLRPVASMLAMQAVLGGLAGFIGVQEADALISLFNMMFGTEADTVSEIIATSDLSDAVKFGAVSDVTGINMSGSFAAGSVIPTRGVGDLPSIKRPLDILAGSYNLVRDLITGEFSDRSAVPLAQAITPASLVWAQEAIMQNPDTGMIPNPRADWAGQVERAPFTAQALISDPEWRARFFAARSIKEQKEIQANVIMSKDDKDRARKLGNLLDRAQSRIAAGKEIDDLVEKAMEAGTPPKQFISSLLERVKNENIEANARKRGIAPNTLKQFYNYQKEQKITGED